MDLIHNSVITILYAFFYTKASAMVFSLFFSVIALKKQEKFAIFLFYKIFAKP